MDQASGKNRVKRPLESQQQLEKLNFDKIKVIDPANLHYEHRSHLIKWIHGIFKCIYCGHKTTIQKSLGRSECSFHPKELIRSGNDNVYKCCGYLLGSKGCVSCDHTETSFSITYDRVRDLYPCWIEIPYAYWRSYLYDIPSNSIIRHRIVFMNNSKTTEKWNESESVNFWESMVWVRRYDYKTALPLYTPPGVNDNKKKISCLISK